MDKKPYIKHVDRDQWYALTKRFLDYNYTQNWDYGISCAKIFNAKNENIAIMDENEVIGLALVRIKQVPVLRSGIAYISGGPLTRCEKTDDLDRFKKCVDVILEEYVRKRKMVLRILMPVGLPERNFKEADCMLEAGMKKTTLFRGYRTILLDVSWPLEEIRMGFTPDWMRNLKFAEKNEIKIESGKGEKLFLEFCDVYEQMLTHKRFYSFLSPSFYLALQKQLPDVEKFEVWLAEIDGKPVAGAVLSIMGDTCTWLLGASNEMGRKTSASFLLHTNFIEHIKNIGLHWYDTGGCDPVFNPGGYSFKKRTGGMEIILPGPFQALPAGLKGYMVLAAEKIYRLIIRRSGRGHWLHKGGLS